MKYKTFIFDFDYTLADATVGIVECVNYALEQMGFPAESIEAIRYTVGMTLGDMFSTLTGITDESLREQFFPLFLKRADEMMADSTVLFVDAIDVVKQLREKGCNTAIVSTKVRYRIEEILGKFGITDLFDFVIGLEDVTEPKPSPEGLLKATRRFGVEHSSVLYIGDSLIDANTANNARIDFAAVLTGTTTHNDFQTLPNVCIAKSLTEMLSFCKTL